MVGYITNNDKCRPNGRSGRPNAEASCVAMQAAEPASNQTEREKASNWDANCKHNIQCLYGRWCWNHTGELWII